MKPETAPLYPERASSNVAERVKELKDIIEGETPKWEISPEEREAVLTIERELGTKLEAIRAITPREVSFNLQYLLTPAGAEDFASVTDSTIPADINTTDDLRRYLYEQTEYLTTVPQKSLTPLGGRSTKFAEQERANHLHATMEEDGKIDTEHLPPMDATALRLTPELDVEKTTRLREFKAELKSAQTELSEQQESTDYTEMLTGIYELYQSKVNELIAERVSTLASITKKADQIGVEALSEAEQQALKLDTVSNNPAANLGRYDKFLTGASSESDSAGWRKQVGSELTALADQQEEIYLQNALHKRELIEQKGLDPEKIAAESIPAAEVEQYCEETLAHYNLLSEEPASEYTPNRPGPAADGKWQVIVKDSYDSLLVNGKQRVIKCPNKPQTIDKLIGVSLAHEIEGHALQHTNRSQIPLKLFENIGSDRSSIFAEAGAVANENQVKEEAFGFQKVTHPHYIRAMARKHEGGNYGDCLESYYYSAIKAHQLKLEDGSLTPAEFQQECIRELEEAINRTSRLFRNGADTTDNNPHLAESKATVYLEQTKLARELQENGLAATLNLTGVNLTALRFLLKADMLDLDSIKKPDLYALEVWKRLADDYTLPPEAKVE